MHAKRASAIGAAFANGCAANGIDVDDSARYAYGHAGAQIFSTALAVAEARHLSGAQLLTGMVVGYEIAHRVGRCWHASRPEYQACGSWGSVACAAVAAHLMGLPAEQAWHAMGIAEYHAPNLPMMRDVDHPAMVKHGIEWAAMTGIVSAELAERGFTGIPGILSFEEYQGWGQDIGQNYLMVEGVAWKEARYACCGWAHAGVEGARRLVLENDIDLDDIAHIRVEGCHGSFRLGTRLPTTLEEAQFNQAWPLAAMLVDGEVGPAQMLEAAPLGSRNSSAGSEGGSRRDGRAGNFAPPVRTGRSTRAICQPGDHHPERWKELPFWAGGWRVAFPTGWLGPGTHVKQVPLAGELCPIIRSD